ncbi:hypothetical protein CTA1_8689 [Colletotrichum tanaceti]|uniref:Uncharacterized protein n=1 Tax=Colletotrichum tanaceti TaxID=1306861 RepID=A0A4U6XSF0_9PEZI|nr:hypothetical protein CTA1_8689 [Colletotrichum tanaceti]
MTVFIACMVPKQMSSKTALRHPTPIDDNSRSEAGFQLPPPLCVLIEDDFAEDGLVPASRGSHEGGMSF